MSTSTTTTTTVRRTIGAMLRNSPAAPLGWIIVGGRVRFVTELGVSMHRTLDENGEHGLASIDRHPMRPMTEWRAYADRLAAARRSGELIVGYAALGADDDALNEAQVLASMTDPTFTPEPVAVYAGAVLDAVLGHLELSDD